MTDQDPLSPEETETETEEELPPPLVYADEVEFFDQLLAPMVIRRLRGIKWCAQWELHDEAVAIMRALWETWELAEAQPVPSDARAVWHRDFKATLLDQLFAESGPFHSCSSADNHHTDEPHTLTRSR